MNPHGTSAVETAESSKHPHPSVTGWGADLKPESRPGVPEELTPPHPVGNAHWLAPEQQIDGVVAVRGAGRPVTPVYGTTIPPRGLSGLVRRAAYTIPDYRPSHWMLLLLGDRIDVVEHNVRPLAMLAGGLAVGVIAIRALRR